MFNVGIIAAKKESKPYVILTSRVLTSRAFDGVFETTFQLTNSGQFTSYGPADQWLSQVGPGFGAPFELLVSPHLGTAPLGAPIGQWVSLGTSRFYYWSNSTYGSARVRIREAATGLEVANVILTTQYQG